MDDPKDVGPLTALGLGRFKPVLASRGAAENEEDDEAGCVEDARRDQSDPDSDSHPAQTAKKLQEEHQDRRFDQEYHEAVERDCDDSNLFKTNWSDFW